MINSKVRIHNLKNHLKTPKFFIFLAAFFLLTFNFAPTVRAAFPIAVNLEVNDSEIKDGSIISTGPNGLVRSKISYDPALVGVVSDNPTLVIHFETDKTRSIVSGGDSRVLVSKKNGDIKKGDFITSSDNPGVGVKASQSGYVLGLALEDFPREGATGDAGTVLTEINIHYNVPQGSSVGLPVLERIGQGFLNNLDNPSDFIRLSRYTLAAIVALIVIFISFFTFARSVRNGIEAMGRNPMAKRSIQTGMVINAIIISILAIFGIAIAYLIIRFF